MRIDNKFIEEYDGLIKKRLAASGLYGERQDNMKSKVYERVLRSESYDPKRGELSTWLWQIVRSVISNETKKEQRSKDVMDNECLQFESIGAIIGQESAGSPADELTRIFEDSKLSTRDESMVRDYYLNNCSLKDLGRLYKMKSRAVEQVIYRAMKTLREYATNLGN